MNKKINFPRFFFLSDRPLNVSLITNVTNKVCAGITVRFTCSADANPPVRTFFLYENNASIGRMENVGTFIKKIDSIGHFVFRCEVNNSVQGLSRSGYTMLIVNGKLAQIYCIVVMVQFAFNELFSNCKL